jgi:hypothetical protein
VTRTALVITILSLVSGEAKAQTIRDLARDHDPDRGPLYITLSATSPALDVDSLKGDADLIVEATVEGSHTELSGDERRIETVSLVRLIRVLFQRGHAASAPYGAITTVLVRQMGGRLDVDGRTVIENDSRLRPFDPAAHLVLFLKRPPEGGAVYDICGGGFGAYAVREHRVFSLLTHDAAVHRFDGIDLDRFAAVVRAP